MSPRVWITAFSAVAACGGSSLSQADPGLPQDMKAVIALQVQPCDKVVSVKRNADSDYLVACQDGNKYHVFVDAKGRAVVQKQ